MMQFNSQTLNETNFKESLQRKINEFKTQNLDHSWLDELILFFEAVRETFEMFRLMNNFAITTLNGMRITKHNVNGIEYAVPETHIFEAIKTNLM